MTVAGPFQGLPCSGGPVPPHCANSFSTSCDCEDYPSFQPSSRTGHWVRKFENAVTGECGKRADEIGSSRTAAVMEGVADEKGA